MKVHTLDRRKHRIDRDHTNRQTFFLIPLSRYVAPPMLHRQLHVERCILIQRGDMQVRGQDRHIRIMNNVRPLRFTGSLLLETERLRLVGMNCKSQPFDIQNNGGDILRDARNRGELMQDPFNLYGGHCRTGQRRQQHAPQRIADGRSEPTLVRLGGKPAERLGMSILVDFHPHRDLKVLHRFYHDSPFISSSSQPLNDIRSPQDRLPSPNSASTWSTTPPPSAR